MPYLRNEPLATDDLDVSQPKLANNTNSADNSFGVDHYPFSDLTADNGHHNQATTPLIVGATHPVTDSTHTIFYCMQDSANLGLLQYSRGPSDAVPSPVTYLQSPAAPIVLLTHATTNILDFTGINKAMFSLYYGNLDTANPFINEVLGWFVNGLVPPFKLFNIVTSTNLQTQTTGNILQLFNNTASTDNNVFWALKFHRIWS